MTLVMAYVALIAAGVAATAVVLEAVLRGRSIGTRGVWVTAMGFTIVATLFAMVAPQPVMEVVIDRAVTTSNLLTLQAGPAPLMAAGPAAVAADKVLAVSDSLLPAAWLVSSLVLLVALVIGQRRFRLERSAARSVIVAGHDVLLTENLGPAVAGVRRPVVFVPRWVLALDDGSQRLLLAHEAEHVKGRDTSLLLFGAVAAALTPWNPVVWWMVRRLRLAVEQDCDARVLATHPGVRRYADLLLTAASRHGLSARLLAAHFGEYTSDLVRRIEAMTSKQISWRKLGGATFMAAALVAAACEAPRPEPVAPFNAEGAKVPPQLVSASDILYEFQVEKPVSLAVGSTMPKYPAILREAGVEGEVLASFVVEESGQAVASSFKVIRSTHELFARALREALPGMRFTPAEVGGRKMKQLVQQPFTFTIAGTKSSVSSEVKKFASAEIVVTGVPGELRRPRTSSSSPVEMVEIPVDGRSQEKRAAFIVRRGDESASTPPDIVVYSFNGKELARQEGEGNLLEKIAPASIHSVEVFKPNGCRTVTPCPLIKIKLLEGQTLRLR